MSQLSATRRNLQPVFFYATQTRPFFMLIYMVIYLDTSYFLSCGTVIFLTGYRGFGEEYFKLVYIIYNEKEKETINNLFTL